MLRGEVYARKTGQVLRCAYCGKVLKGYYFTCHVCGKNYCYTHMPARCNHLK